MYIKRVILLFYSNFFKLICPKAKNIFQLNLVFYYFNFFYPYLFLCIFKEKVILLFIYLIWF